MRLSVSPVLRNAALAMTLLLPSAVLAQTTATLVGDIFDPSGNSIPNASVTVTSEGTGYARTVTTNAVGQYRITSLNPGAYNVDVKANGFKSQVRKGVLLEVSAVLEVDFTMAIGAVTETVEVTAASPILQTEEASVGRVVVAKELERMPVNGRNYTRLMLLMPGTSSVTRSQSQGTGQSGTSLISVNGGRPQDNNFTLDGFDSNMQMMNSPGISPPMDALQEFKIATNTGSDFGRSMGANVSMVIKSGTNKIHGTAYEFLRNNVLDANEFFANSNSLPKVPFRQNQYGVAIGGPIPKFGLRQNVLVCQLGRLPPPSQFHPDWQRAHRRLQQRRLLGVVDPIPTHHRPESVQQQFAVPQQRHPARPDQSGHSDRDRVDYAAPQPPGNCE